MKEHLIRETKEEEEHNRYSTYRNPDAKLKKEIKNFKIDTTKVELGWPEKEWTIIEYEKDEVKCQSGRNTNYFPLEEVKEALAEKLEYERNQKFQPHHYFKKHFGIISHLSKYKNDMTLDRIDMLEPIFIGKIDVDPTSVEHYGNFYKYEVDYQEDDEITLKAHNSGSSLNLYFDENGDYVNRNYNENLNYYKCEDISPDVVLEHFKKLIKKLGKSFGHSNGKYYTEKYCIVPYSYDGDEYQRDAVVGVELFPAQSKGTYKKYRQPAIKRPKNLEEVSSAHLIEKVMSLMPPSIVELFASKEGVLQI